MNFKNLFSLKFLKTVKISKKLLEELTYEAGNVPSNRSGERQSILFALGSDKKKYITVAIQLSQQEYAGTSCWRVPGVTSKVMTDAYIELNKRGLSFVGFALIADKSLLNDMKWRNYEASGWGGYMGDLPSQFPGIPVIVITDAQEPFVVKYDQSKYKYFKISMKEFASVT